MAVAAHDWDGQGVVPERGLTLDDDDDIERYRDLLMLQHVALGVPYNTIGKIMGVHGMTVRRHVAAMPADLRRRYGVK